MSGDSVRSRRPWSTANTAGTKNSVATVADRQPADDRAAERRVLLAAFAEAERHRHHADDHRERRHQHRTEPREARVERRGQRRAARAPASSFAKLTTRMLFAVATPMHMIAPVSAGTLIVVCVTNSIQTMPASAPGSADDDDERIEPGLEVDDDQQVDEHDRHRQAGQQAEERRAHRLDLAAHDDLRAARQILARARR